MSHMILKVIHLIREWKKALSHCVSSEIELTEGDTPRNSEDLVLLFSSRVNFYYIKTNACEDKAVSGFYIIKNLNLFLN